ncbi:MAG TPA: 50S ribosomal protein L11 [Candidatus Syntrophosphaera sp.]|jgi:large subunit ribosomal protein L11|nr:50S ribosomal protein L11 [Candidatus Cloacimonadota bacterium]OQB90997.1 MAG: 50S ribosomal protein L11 [Candidatus Cloacimonetes bacterium ADurb.Bin117]HNU54377.1 50S ribosomal protein L11 [Candidatus Syntrophosphaera sp.]MDI9524776.1 50S ribosomal protein L11 [Candidatus Cloacimonadota bacterium]HOG31593.1 50S ribosomal protein L11 [Candidatus Cloacimonadota bacterium]
MAKPKDVAAILKLQLPAGKATPAPPVGPALGQVGVNIPEFCRQFNEKTADQPGMVFPVVIYVAKNKSFTFEIKTPPASVLIKKEAGLAKGSATPNKVKVGHINQDQLRNMAQLKIQDMNCNTLESAMSMIAGTARSMGVVVDD